MRKRLSLFGLALPATFAFAIPGVAQADTLGITSRPTPSSTSACFSGDVFVQTTSDPSTPYTVPVGGGKITQWQTSTAGATAGAPVTFVVARPVSGSSSYTIVGSDTENLPNPLPASGTASYPLATPIAVTGGETLGLYSSVSSNGPTCLFEGGAVPGADTVDGLAASGTPTAGQTLSPGAGPSPGSITVNVAATLVRAPYDAGVSASASPSTVSPGQYALLSSTVTDHGPGTGPITFTDIVPAGLSIGFATAGSGSCATSGQTVTCTISGLTAGQSAPVNILVTPSGAGKYTNPVSVAVQTGSTDPNPGNNSTSATLTVGAPAIPHCVVPSLASVPSGAAKAVLRDLGCGVRTSTSHSSKVGKGLTIRTRPGKGSYAFRRTITVVVSSGPKKAKKHHGGKAHHKKHAVLRPAWRR